MRRAMCKLCDAPFKRFAARLTELNNYLPLFIGSSVYKKITHKDLNKILLHSVLNGGGKQTYLQGWDFEMQTYKVTCNMLKHMEIAEQFY